MEKNIPYWVALLLVIVGGLNWGLVGAFNFNLVAALFGHISMLTRAVGVARHHARKGIMGSFFAECLTEDEQNCRLPLLELPDSNTQ